MESAELRCLDMAGVRNGGGAVNHSYGIRHHGEKERKYRQIFFMNRDVKFLNRVFANQTQNHIGRIILQDQIGFIPEM